MPSNSDVVRALLSLKMSYVSIRRLTETLRTQGVADEGVTFGAITAWDKAIELIDLEVARLEALDA